MPKFLRAALFALFLIAFLICAPLLVLYTAGYRFDLNSGRVVHTAVLNISSIPRDAAILIDGIDQERKTPSVLKHILPGDHMITLKKEGYLAWEGKFSFESNGAVISQDIALFIESDAETLLAFDATLIAFDQNNNHVAYATSQNFWVEVWTADLTKNMKRLLMRLPYEATSEYSLSLSKNGTYLCVAQKNKKTLLAVSKIDTGENIDSEGLGFVDNFWWDAWRDDVLFTQKDGTTIKHALSDSTQRKVGYDPKHAGTFDSSKDVFLEESNNRIALSFFDGTVSSIITYLPLGNYELRDSPHGLILLFDTARSRLVLIDANSRDQPILLSEEAVTAVWDVTDTLLAFSNGYDLKIYNPSNHEIKTVTRLSERITNIGWHSLPGILMYQVGGNTFAIDAIGMRATTQTLLVKDVSGAFWETQDGKSLYIVDEKNGGDVLRRPLRE